MDLRYTPEHEWLTLEGTRATVGITDHAQQALGDLVFVQLPQVGTSVTRGATIAVVESVKAASDIFAPLTGRIAEVNTAAVSDPALVNKAPIGAGWLFKIDLSDAAELSQLLDESAYLKIVAAE
jgi:glycine cleavage system H protein